MYIHLHLLDVSHRYDIQFVQCVFILFEEDFEILRGVRKWGMGLPFLGRYFLMTLLNFSISLSTFSLQFWTMGPLLFDIILPCAVISSARPSTLSWSTSRPSSTFLLIQLLKEYYSLEVFLSRISSLPYISFRATWTSPMSALSCIFSISIP